MPTSPTLLRRMREIAIQAQQRFAGTDSGAKAAALVAEIDGILDGLAKTHTGRATLDALVVEAEATNWRPSLTTAAQLPLADAFDARAAEFGFGIRAWRGTATVAETAGVSP